MKQFYKKFLKKIAHFQVNNPYFSIALLLVFSVFIWGGISSVETQTSLEKMMPRDIEEIKAFNTLRDNNLGKDSIILIISLDENSPLEENIYDIKDKEVYDYIRDLENVLIKQSDIISTNSYTSLVGENQNYNDIVNSTHINNYVSQDKKTTTLILQSDIARDGERVNLLVEKVQDIVGTVEKPSGVEVDYTGTPIIQQKLGELVNSDRTNTQWISTLFVMLITIIVFRSITSSIIPIFVVFLSVNWLYGTMGYTGLPISTLAGGVAAMVIGIGIDFAIHIMNKFKYERKANNSIKKSVELAVIHTGSALTTTSLTTIAAFLAFLVGVMPEMGRFGILMAIGIFYSLVFSIFGLPALLVIEEEIIQYVKNKFRFGIEKEYHLEGVEK